MNCNEVENPRKYTFSIDDSWSIEVIEHAKVPMKAFDDDNYFKTEWFFIATKPASFWFPGLGGNRLTGIFMTEYDDSPGPYDIIKGIANTFTDECIYMTRYLCQE